MKVSKSRPWSGPTLVLGALGFLLFSALASSAATCVPPPSGLVGWWRAENSGADFIGSDTGYLSNGVDMAHKMSSGQDDRVADFSRVTIRHYVMDC
jgi:hypothetical protein